LYFDLLAALSALGSPNRSAPMAAPLVLQPNFSFFWNNLLQ
jgi:hypothetical protein